MKKPTDKYWNDRFEEVANSAFKIGDASHKELTSLFKKTYKDMNEQIQQFYYKYGVMAESPSFTVLADGSQVISGVSKKLTVPITEAMKPLVKGNRLKALEQQLTDTLKIMGTAEKTIFINTLSAVVNDTYYTTIYELYKGFEMGTSFNLLSKSTVKALINNPVNGKMFSDRIWSNTAKLADNVNQTLRGGITQGLSNREMAKRIENHMGTGFKNAKRLIDTEVTNTLNQSAMESYKESGVVDRYQYLATLDNRTSDVCANLDNQVFDLDKGITGLNLPPLHVNCRSSTRAYFDNSYSALTRIARNEDGNTFTVPGDMSYKEFAKLYVKN